MNVYSLVANINIRITNSAVIATFTEIFNTIGCDKWGMFF